MDYFRQRAQVANHGGRLCPWASTLVSPNVSYVTEGGGLFFCRLGSSIGMESQIEHIEGRRYKSPDGSSDISWTKPYSARSPNG